MNKSDERRQKRVNNTIENHYQVSTRLLQLMTNDKGKARWSPRLNGECRDAVLKIAMAMKEELASLEPTDASEAPTKYSGRKIEANRHWEYLIAAAEGKAILK